MQFVAQLYRLRLLPLVLLLSCLKKTGKPPFKIRFSSNKPQKLLPTQKRGFALLLVISLIVLLSALITAFLSQGIQGSKISRAQSSHYRTEYLARSALQTIVSDLRREIENGSTIEALPNGQSLYLPKNRSVQFPTKNIATTQKSLLKVSRHNTPFTSNPELLTAESFANYPINSRSDESDIKGRKVPLEQWNRPLFQGGESIIDQAPDWVLVSREGIVTQNHSNDLPQMADRSSNNPRFVLGRYAFVVYDQGGLLNANEAGAPSTADDDFKTRRGRLSQINLSDLPGINLGGGLADWRWGKLGSSLEVLKKTLFETRPTKDQVRAGGRGFLSRKELIRYSKQFPQQVTPESLKYLTHYHRTFNAPSFIPDPKRPKTGTETTAYRLDDQINPSLFTVKDFKGGLFLKKRFPLSRLSVLEKGTDTEAIEKYFGLRKTDKPYTWTYNHGDSGRILRLSEVALLNREPDLFEILKAAIQVGSLGKNLTYTASYFKIGTPEDLDSPHASTDNQIIEIGLNLIDQWDEDSYPTRIYFDNDSANRGEFFGTENLPGLYRVVGVPYQQGTGAGTPVEYWEQPELWNPHQPPLTASAKAPTNLRFVGNGSAFFLLNNVWNPTNLPISSLTPAVMTDIGENIGIEFSPTVSQSCREPSVLTRTNSTAHGANLPSSSTYPFVGLYFGRAISTDTNYYNHILEAFTPWLDFELQYQVQNTWVTYNRIDKISQSCGGMMVGVDPLYPQGYKIFRNRSDPRTSRFGHTINDTGTGPAPGTTTLRPNRAIGSFCWDPTMFPSLYNSTGWIFGAIPNAGFAGLLGVFYPGELSENTRNSSTRYFDPDGVLRPADGAYAGGTTNAGYPQIAANFDSRPVILNRPFRSVAEIGYVFRATPWKTLDLFTAESADSSLLDYFCLDEMDENGIVSNQINLNTPYEEILTARLIGTAKKESDLSQTITKTQAQAIAKKMIADLESEAIGPFQNRNELVTRLISKIDYGSESENIIKPQRETALRALANDADTRTWNLMIDLVAQTGSYSNASRKHSDFDVKGQSHYWMHLSIDRFTGKILDTKWESITD